MATSGFGRIPSVDAPAHRRRIIRLPVASDLAFVARVVCRCIAGSPHHPVKERESASFPRALWG